MKMLNRIESSFDPWGTLLITGLQLDFMPLITILWAQSLSQFSVYVAVSAPSLYSSIIFFKRFLWQTASKVFLKSR